MTLTVVIDPQRWAETRGSQVMHDSLNARHELRTELCEHVNAYLVSEGLGEVVKLQ